MLLGAHMSVAGGLEKALLIGKEVGCQTIQIFTKNNNQWNAKPLTPQEISLFLKTKDQTEISPVFAHASYLINIGSPEEALYKKSIEALLDELKRCEKIGLSFLVLHPGAHRESGEEEALKKISQAINIVFQKTEGYRTMLLLENTAGQGTCIGHLFEHLAMIIENVLDKERIGVCFDTCHAFQAGYDMRTRAGYEKTFKDFDETVGLSKIKAFHLNDSKKEFHQRVDRHEHIGKGSLGKEAFQFLMNDKRFQYLPMVLETPKGKARLEDKENLSLLRSFIKN